MSELMSEELTDADRARYRERYVKAAHGMQSGVAAQTAYGSKQCDPKHLRVGVNAAMSDLGAVARLLIAKGVFTEREYLEAICKGMEDERDSYEAAVQALMGSTAVKLG